MFSGFVGGDISSYFSDLWVLDLDRAVWTFINQTGQLQPSPRAWGSFQWFNDSQVVAVAAAAVCCRVASPPA